MKNLLSEAEEIKGYTVFCRRRLHAFAECGFSLPKTLSFVKKELQNLGFAPKPCGRSGLVCELSSPSPSPLVLLRADMDALPLKEETRLPFRAENGHMHACGHDMHAAMLLGAAALLKKKEAHLPASVRFAFQGAEETLSGAADMKEAGILSGVGAAMMIHTVTAVPFETGTVLLPPAGIAAPAARFFEIEILGESAHVGDVGAGKDALLAAIALYREMKKEGARLDDLFLAVGKFTAGDAPNVLPSRACLSGSFRSKNGGSMAAFQKILLSLTKQTPEGITAHVRFLGACPPLKNNGALISRLANILPAHGFSSIQMPAGKGNAAEDFAHIANDRPAVALAIAAGEAGRGYEYPLHHPRALFDEDVLPTGAALYAIGATVLGNSLALQTFTKGGGA